MKHRSITLGALALLLATEFSLTAQYPPGGYPPGRYPGGGGIPFPRRGKKKTSKEAEKQETLQDVSGMLRQLDEKFVIVEAQDTRVINLTRSTNTKFYKNGEEIKTDVLKPGDHLRIEATQDEQGFFHA